MIINFSNIGNTGGGGGGGYVLPTATANRLGGIKVGSGLTITNAGVLSADEATVIDLAVLSAMTSADRIALWDEVYAKVYGGKSVFMKGLVQGESDRTAILPVVSFRPETSGATHEGGNIFFGAKGDTDNIYFHINFSSDGTILPAEGMAKTAIAKTAGADTLGMVKVGSGLTIDANGVLSATGGGSGGGDYLVVSQLPATGSAAEYALYYVKPYVENVPYIGISISTNIEEGYVAHIIDPDNNDTNVYISGTDFHWGFENDGEYHKKDDADFYYKTDNENKTINVYLPNSSWTVSLEEGATSASTEPYIVQIQHDAETYRFDGTGFTRAGGYDNVYIYFDYNDRDDSTKRQELINKVFAVQAENRKNIRLFVSNLNYEYFRSFENGQYALFVPTWDFGGGVRFTSSIMPYNGGGQHDNPVFMCCSITPDGGLDFDMVQVPYIFVLNVDPSTHSLDPNGENWMFIHRSAQDGYRARPIIKLVYGGTCFDAVYKENYIYLDAKHEGINLHGVWMTDDGGSALVEWSEAPDMYQSVSGLSNAGRNVVSFINEVYSVPASCITNLTGETELFIKDMYGAKCKVTTDGTDIYMYGDDGEGGWVERGSGSWTSETIETSDIDYSPHIYDIATGNTTYQFSFVYGDYGEPGNTVSITPFYRPFEGLLAFDQSNASLNLYAGGHWNTIYPQV